MNVDKSALLKIIQEEIENIITELSYRDLAPGQLPRPPKPKTVRRTSASNQQSGGYSPADPQASYGGPQGSNRDPETGNPITPSPSRSKKRRRRKEFVPKSLEQALNTKLDRRGRYIRPKKKRVSRRVPKSLEDALKEDNVIYELDETDFQPMPKSGAREPDPRYRDPREEDYEIDDQKIGDALNTATSHIQDAFNMTQGPMGVVDEKMRKVIKDHITSLYRNFVLGRDASLGLSDDEPEEVPGLEESIYDINEADLFEVDTSCDGIEDDDQRERCEDARKDNRVKRGGN